MLHGSPSDATDASDASTARASCAASDGLQVESSSIKVFPSSIKKIIYIYIYNTHLAICEQYPALVMGLLSDISRTTNLPLDNLDIPKVQSPSCLRLSRY